MKNLLLVLLAIGSLSIFAQNNTAVENTLSCSEILSLINETIDSRSSIEARNLAQTIYQECIAPINQNDV